MAQNRLTKAGQHAKDLVDKLCMHLTKIVGRRFYASNNLEEGTWEGHIYDTAKYVEDENGNVVLSDDGKDEVGMIFWGGHFYDNVENAESEAWISLLEDCIGLCRDEDIRDQFKLSKYLHDISKVDINLDFSSIEEFEIWIDAQEKKLK